MMQYRIRRDAQRKGQMVFYVQAIDVSKDKLDAEDYKKMLEFANYNDAGHAMGMLGVYVGMRVRLDRKISQKHGLVQGAEGEVVGVVFNTKDDMKWLDNPDAEEFRKGYCVLGHMPAGVQVKFDGFEEDVGLGKGVVLVEPDTQGWTYKTRRPTNVMEGKRPKNVQVDVDVARTQIRLFPAQVLTTNACQGKTLDPLVLHLGAPPRMGDDEYWLNLYVMLSRARTLDPARVAIFDLPPEDFFARGPPPELVMAMQRLERLEERTRAFAPRVREFLGWDLEGQGAKRRVRPERRPLPKVEALLAKRTKAKGKMQLPLASARENLGMWQGTRLRDRPAAMTRGAEECYSRQADRGAVRSRLQLGTLQPRIHGFENDGRGSANGNLCYMNAAMQVLLRVDPLRSWVAAHCRGSACAHAEGSCSLCLAKGVLHAFEKAAIGKPMQMRGLVEAVRHRSLLGDRFCDGRQKDAGFFLEALLCRLAADEKRASADVSRLGLLESLAMALVRRRTGCTTCSATREDMTERMVLPLDLASVPFARGGWT